MDGGADRPSDVTWSGPRVIEQGEFAGWKAWPGLDPFEDQSGPFYFREAADGTIRCAFRAQAKHMNGGGFMHGGCLMTFADFCLFGLAFPVLRDVRAVTVTLNGEFAGSAGVGALIEGTGEVVRDGGLVFIRGLVSTEGRPLLNFSGVVKKLKPRSG